MARTKKRTQTKKEPAVKKTSLKKKTGKNVLKVPAESTSLTKEKLSLGSLIHEPSWSEHLQEIFQSKNFQSIEQFLNTQWANGQATYPPNNLIFEAFNQTPFDKVKVVLLGQDPYHDNGQV